MKTADAHNKSIDKRLIVMIEGCPMVNLFDCEIALAAARREALEEAAGVADHWGECDLGDAIRKLKEERKGYVPLQLKMDF